MYQNIYLRRRGDLRLGGDHLLGDGDLRRLNGDQRPLSRYEDTWRGERDRDRLRLSRLRDLDLEFDRDRDREAEDLDLLRLRPFLSRDRFRPPERDLDLDLERELECSLLKWHKENWVIHMQITRNQTIVAWTCERVQWKCTQFTETFHLGHGKVLPNSFRFSGHILGFSYTSIKARTTLCSIINSTKGKYCSVAFIWMVTPKDFTQRLKR